MKTAENTASAALGIALAAALVLVTSVGAHAAEPAPLSHAAEPPTRSLAVRAARFPQVKTATADFAQEREVSLVDDVLRAAGTLALAAPSSFRLDITEPQAMTLIATGATTIVIDASGKALPLPAEFAGLATFAHTLTDLLLGTRAPAGFAETWRDADTVVLTPASEATSPFREITLQFSANGPLPATIVMRERGGDRTTIRLDHVALNPPLTSERFLTPTTEGSKGPLP